MRVVTILMELHIVDVANLDGFATNSVKVFRFRPYYCVKMAP
jgi:hypothetical protein